MAARFLLCAHRSASLFATRPLIVCRANITKRVSHWQRARMTTASTPVVSARQKTDAVSSAALRNKKIIGFWLLTTAGAVFFMVVLGGVTRLTRSGLSIVEWKSSGEKLPTSDSEWEVEFQKYKQVSSDLAARCGLFFI